MVFPDRVIQASIPVLQVDGEGLFVFPAHFLIWNLTLKNLLITKTMDQLRSGKPLEQRLADLIDDYQMEGHAGCMVKYDCQVYTVNFTRREWVGYQAPRAANASRNHRIILVRHIKGRSVESELPWGAPYYYIKGEGFKVVSGTDELRYNKHNMTLVRSKLPIDLRSYNPVAGDNNQILKQAPVKDSQNAKVDELISRAINGGKDPNKLFGWR